MRAVYCAIDPAAAILEVAVHKGFKTLDTVPHVLTSMTVTDFSAIHVVRPEDVPNPNWSRPGLPSAGQQSFGDGLLAAHRFVLLPSVISSHGWNLVFLGGASGEARGYAPRTRERFALDTRPHPVVPQTESGAAAVI